MIRLACLFGLIALAVLVLFVVRLEGATAILYVFVGFPALALGLTLYAIRRWRAGAFRSQ
jgi:hypothetical protein